MKVKLKNGKECEVTHIRYVTLADEQGNALLAESAPISDVELVDYPSENESYAKERIELAKQLLLEEVGRVGTLSPNLSAVVNNAITCANIFYDAV